MSFTSLSAALLLVAAVGVVLEVRRGMRRGLTPTVLSLSALAVSALAAAPLAVWLSDYPARALTDLVFGDLVPEVEPLLEQFPSVGQLLQGGVDALISPVLFVLLFLLLRAVTGLIMALVIRIKYAPLPHEVDDPRYESRNAPFHRRHGKLFSGVTGGICGLLASLILLSPVVGTLCTLRDFLIHTEDVKIKWSTVGLSEENLAMAKATVSDPGAAILEAMGCGLIFDASANTYLNGHRVGLRREVDACMTVVGDLLEGMKVFSDPAKATPEELEALSRLGEQINRSEAAKLLSADFLNQIATAWLEGMTFLKIPRPQGGELADPLLEGLLQVCAVSTPDCVGRDIHTLVSIYVICHEEGLLTSPDYDLLAKKLDEGDMLGRIYDELLANPCTEHLAGELTNMALRIMAKGLKMSDFSSSQLENLMGDLSDAMNLVNGMSSSYEEQVQSMKEYTLHYAEQYGIALPESLAEMAAAALVDRLGNQDAPITGEDMEDIFDQYMNGD